MRGLCDCDTCSGRFDPDEDEDEGEKDPWLTEPPDENLLAAFQDAAAKRMPAAVSEGERMIFSESDYESLHALVFRPDYSGYKPTVTEIPNGDGKADADKRYAHVAVKYLVTEQQRADLTHYLERAHVVARYAALLAGIPDEFMPDARYGALRVLDYPPGAISNKHEDFDLFTLMCFRDQPEYFVSDEVNAGQAIKQIRTLNHQAHLGQIGAVIGLGAATPHEVLSAPTRQRSIVYFAIPDHDAVLPSGITVRDWLNERMERSRTEFKKYE